jgi:AhpD family alkylhydroperoxidase
MPRVALCDEETGALMRGTAGPEARRALMHRPDAAHAIGAWNEASNRSELPPRLHELVRYRIALLNDCARCRAYRRPEATRAGATEDLLGGVELWRTDDRFEPLERDALDFAERFVFDHASIDDDLLDRLRTGLGDGGLVDLASCVAKYLAVGRLISVLDLDQDVSGGVTVVSTPTAGAS